MPSAASLDMIRRLIGHDTTSRLSNLDLIEDVRAYLAGLGVDAVLVHDETGTKANLYATIGPQDRPGICLSGHTDVVPVDGQNWSSDPFTLTESEGRLYGRGTSDMKSFLAVALAFAPDMARAKLKTPIHFALSYDEEVGCLGVRRLIAMLNDAPVKPAAVIVGEPTSMQVITAHKGKKSYRATVRGLAAHSSLSPHGVNAVEFAALAIAKLRQMAEELGRDGPFDPDFDVPHTTAHVGTIQGGIALNIVPERCVFEYEFRHLPADDPLLLQARFEAFVRNELEPRMQAIDPTTGFDFAVKSEFPALDMRGDEPIVRLAKHLAGRNDHSKVAYGTEAGLFQRTANIPTIVCGPGSIEQAHKPDEFVTLEQIDKCEGFMRRLIEHAATNALSG